MEMPSHEMKRPAPLAAGLTGRNVAGAGHSNGRGGLNVKHSGAKRPILDAAVKCSGPGQRHLADFGLVPYQSAESRIFIKRLRCRLRAHTLAAQATTMTPSPALTMAPQPIVAPDVHSSTAPSTIANTIIPVASLISERSVYISLWDIIVRPAAVGPQPNGVLFRLPHKVDVAQIPSVKAVVAHRGRNGVKAAVCLGADPAYASC